MERKTIKAADLPKRGEALDGGTFVTCCFIGDQQIALVDLGAASEFEGPWGDYGQDVKTGRADGLANTLAMAEAGSEIAKRALELGAHIPSTLESELLMIAKSEGLISDLREDRRHWTSTQFSAHYAYYMDFKHGWLSFNAKSYTRLVRPVRSYLVIQ